MVSRNNRNLKLIAGALEMRSRDIADAAGVSRSRADGWMRGEGSRKSGSGNSSAATAPRFREMDDAAFDRFCEGLRDWFDAQDDDTSEVVA